MWPHRRIIASLLVIIIAFSILSPIAQSQDSRMTVSEPQDITLPDAPGQQITPAMVSYKGVPYLFWSSNTAAATGDGDFDIIYSTFEDDSWTSQHVLTTEDSGYDHTPQPIVFEGNLYLFWSSDDPVLSEGNDVDIVFSIYNGNVWTQAISLTSDFNAMGDYNPFPVIFNSQLFVFFEWYNIDTSSFEIAYLVNDGDAWSEVNSITAASSGHNLNPSAAVNGNSLILVWETFSQDLTESSVDSAIVSSIFSADAWSNFTSVSGTAGPNNHDPYAITYSGLTWVFWYTNSPSISGENDYDIVGRSYDQGEWGSTVFELSGGGSGDDTGIMAIVHDEKLIVSWISGSPEYSQGTDTDIVISEYDGNGWSVPVDISQQDDGRDDAGGFSYKSPALLGRDDKLYIVWETNASPDVTKHSNTWLLMATYGEVSDNPSIMFWIVPIVLILIGVIVLVFLRGRKK